MVGGAFSLTNLSSGQTGSSSLTTLQISPVLQYFLTPQVALGLQVQLAYLTSNGQSATGFGIIPSVGYCFDPSPRVSFLPALEVGRQIASGSGPGSRLAAARSVAGSSCLAPPGRRANRHRTDP
jgi:hypothetical protein